MGGPTATAAPSAASTVLATVQAAGATDTPGDGRCDWAGCHRRARYEFAAASAAGAGGPPVRRCLRHAVFYGPVWRRAIRVALVVGTVLFLINQADLVLAGQVTPRVAAKIALTYLVPFSVSTYSALQMNRIQAR